jgi:hypothetical protein
MIVNDYGLGSPSGCMLTSPNFAVAQSGTISVTMDCSALTGLTGVFTSPSMNVYFDGQYLATENAGWTHTFNTTIDTTTLENRTDHLVWVSVGTSGSGLNGSAPALGAFGILTTSNGAAFRELRMNYKYAYLWQGANTTVSLFWGTPGTPLKVATPE